MATDGRYVSAKDAILLECLAAGMKIDDAAAQSGMSSRSVFRRLQDPEFKRQVGGLRSEAIERTAGALAMAGMIAVSTLVRLCGARSEHAAATAARSLLEMMFRAREITEIERRLALIEQGMPKEDRRWA